MSKIPCIVFIYENVEIIRRSLDRLVKHADILDIYVIENASQSTKYYIEPAMRKMVDEGIIRRYIQMDRNILGNAVEIALESGLIDFTHKYVIFTDGDVIASSDWFDEQISILEKYNHIFCCTVKMDLTGWAPEVATAFPKPLSVHEDYVEIGSGMWLCMFRAEEFVEVTRRLRQNGVRLRDWYLEVYARIFLQKIWVSTQNAIAQELTRCGYATPSYQHEKIALVEQFGGHYRLWCHDDFCDFTVFDKGHSWRGTPPVFKKARAEGETASTDPIMAELAGRSNLRGWLFVHPSAHRKGWVHFVRYPLHSMSWSESGTHFVNWPEGAPAPCFSANFEALYIYQVLQNMGRDDVLNILSHGRAWLMPNGSLRLATMNYDAIVRAHEEQDGAFFDRMRSVDPGAFHPNLSNADYVAKLVNETKTPLNDPGTMTELALAAGFSRVEVSAFDPSQDPNGPEIGAFSVFYNIFP